MRSIVMIGLVSWMGSCSPTPSNTAPDGSAPRERPAWACDDLRRAPASVWTVPLFTDVTSSALRDPEPTRYVGRVTVVDIDGDGLDDIVGTPAHDETLVGKPEAYTTKMVLKHERDGTFSDFTQASGLAGVPLGLMVFGDVDNDGDQDMYGGTISGQGLDQQGIWINDGHGHLKRSGQNGTTYDSKPCGSTTCTAVQITATFVDVDRDGTLDLYVGSWFPSDGVTATRYTPPGLSHLYIGHGDGTFSDATSKLGVQANPLSKTPPTSGRAAMGIAAGDYDNDGDMDLYVANYGAGRPVGPFPGQYLCEMPRYWNTNQLWNIGDSITNVADMLGVGATMRGPKDIQQEPPLVVGSECPGMQGTYPSPIGGNHFTPQWGDFDADGDLDLVVAAVAHPDYLQADRTLLFVNQGAPDFKFTEESLERGLTWREDEKQVGWVDIDGDGLLDLTTTGFRDPATNDFRVYHQKSDHHFELLDPKTTGIDDAHQESMAWLDFDNDGDLDFYLAEDDGTAKLFRNDAADLNGKLVIALAAKAPADATGARITIQTSSGTQIREVTSGNGHYNMQLTRAQYFGLGGDACAGDVTIRWADGEVQKLGGVRAGTRLDVKQGKSVEGTLMKR